MQDFKEYIQSALDSNVLCEVMGWDTKHGPTVEQMQALDTLLGESLESLKTRLN